MSDVRGSTSPAAVKPSKTDKDSGSGKAGQRQILTFEDNRHVTALLGKFDAHLALIEERLKIEAHANGNLITLVGPHAEVALAKDVLETLYDRVREGEEIGNGDIDGLIRHKRSLAPVANEAPGVSGKHGARGQHGAKGMAQLRTRKKIVTARTPMQSAYMRAIESTDLVFGVGPAGTGKTYIAVVAAASYLERGLIDRIILSRPAVEAGERLGFLPGDMREKVDPYLRPLYDALYDVLPPEKVEKDIEAGIIEIAPLAFMRGRTLANAFVILDEAQNTTSMQMKMFLTRLGENAKMVVTGDPTQVDLPPGQKSGLVEAVGLLEGIKEVEQVKFTSKDVVRRDLVARIVEAYDGVDGA